MNYLLGILFVLCTCCPTFVHADTKVYFSPNGGCQESIISHIEQARKSIDIAMYALTSREIAQALIKAQERHVKIKIVLDNAQLKDRSSKSRLLSSKGLDVKFHLGPGLMHDKFAVIDAKEVLSGSFNWTASADKKNAENLLVITDHDVAAKFLKEFKHLWSQSGQGYLLHHTGTDTISFNINNRSKRV